MSASQEKNKPWYREPWLWFVLAGPIIVVFAGFYTFYKAVDTEDTLVTDDYYKEGKSIGLQLERDKLAADNNISAHVYLREEKNGVMVLTKGRYDVNVPLTLLIIHPTLKKHDLSLSLVQSPNNPHQYEASWGKALPHSNNWIVRLEDNTNTWRVENRWIVNQGNHVELKPMETLSNH